MKRYPKDIYSEPATIDPDTLAKRGSEQNGICSNPFLEHAFKTVEYRIKITVSKDGSWKYDEDTVLKIRGQSKLFHHIDRSTLTRIGLAVPNPMMRGRKPRRSWLRTVHQHCIHKQMEEPWLS
jgi:hypothetical protein